MAKVDRIFTFLMQWEAGLRPEFFDLPFEDQFEQAKKTGFANDPADPGGATMVGVTIGTFNEYCRRRKLSKPTVEDLKALTFAQWTDIIKMMYWDRWKADRIKDQAIANVLFDWVWASGVHGIRRPQMLVGVVPDGIVGPKTIDAVNHCDPKVLFNAIIDSRVDFINDTCHSSRVKYEKKVGRPATEKELLKYTKMRFKKGWLNRINAIANIK